jgi:hypothetical protein
MTDFAFEASRFLVRPSPGSWALAIATAFIVLIITGVLPHVLA